MSDRVRKNVNKSGSAKSEFANYLLNHVRESDSALPERFAQRKKAAGIAQSDDIRTFVDLIDPDEKRR